MGLIQWLLGDTDEVVGGQYLGDRTPSERIQPGACGMFVDPAQVPTDLKKPATDAGQPPEGSA